MNYLFGQAPGQALTVEPPLLAMLVFFGVTTLLGALLWFVARRHHSLHDLAQAQLARLANWLFWTGAVALLIAGFFYEGALFRQRFWLYLLLLPIYAVIAYALYFRYTRYPELHRRRQEALARRRRYVPAPESLQMHRPRSTSRSSSRRRRARG